MSISQRIRQASRVARTVYQAIAYAVVAFPGFVVILGIPADKVAVITASAVAGLGLFARLFSALFPAEPPLPPLDT